MGILSKNTKIDRVSKINKKHKKLIEMKITKIQIVSVLMISANKSCPLKIMMIESKVSRYNENQC